MEWLTSLLEPVRWLVDFILHIDQHLKEIIEQFGLWSYAILFLIVFCETGLVVTPFLPGDSLLFAAGALAALGAFDVYALSILLFVAAVIGDAVNFAIARRMRARFLEGKAFYFIKAEHIARTQRFFEKHGAKTIVLARFVPIVRTFAPFVAGIGQMNYRRFVIYNVVGAFVWVGIFVPAGYFFGNLPAVRENFTLVIFAIILVSVMPMAVEMVRARLPRRPAKADQR